MRSARQNHVNARTALVNQTINPLYATRKAIRSNPRMAYTEHYADVKRLNPLDIRGQVREYALNMLCAWDRIRGVSDHLRKPRVQFLYLHHLFRDEEQKLDILLRRLRDTHAFIPYGEAVDRVLQGRIDKPYISISLDDGFKNNMKVAEILGRYDMKGCFFINPGIIGNQSYGEIERYCKSRLNFPPVEFMTWDDAEERQKRGHEIGAHTMEHINVAEVHPDSFREDSELSRQVLQQRCGEIRHFAFPYGHFNHFTDKAREIVFDSGFGSCASAVRGCHISPDIPLSPRDFCIRRDYMVMYWDISHILYFMARNARRAHPSTNLFPYAQP